MKGDADAIDQIAEDQLEKIERAQAEDPNIKKSIKIVEAFLKSHPVMCYGGTAINNLLDEKDRFYDFTRETPDYELLQQDTRRSTPWRSPTGSMRLEFPIFK
jgi:glutamate mutase epsilon subunit